MRGRVIGAIAVIAINHSTTRTSQQTSSTSFSAWMRQIAASRLAATALSLIESLGPPYIQMRLAEASAKERVKEGTKLA